MTLTIEQKQANDGTLRIGFPAAAA